MKCGMKYQMVALALAAAGGPVGAPASAAPGGLADMNPPAAARPLAEPVRHRCYVDSDGDYYCPRHGVRRYSYTYDDAPGFSLYIGRGGRNWDRSYRWRDDRDDWRRPLSLRERR